MADTTAVAIESQCQSKDPISKLAVDVACLSEVRPEGSDPAELPAALLLSLWNVCKELMPGWVSASDGIPSDMTVNQISGGITNMLFLVGLPSATSGGPNRVLARVFGAKTELLINRQKDNAIFHYLSDRGVGPTYWGRFANGRLEGYVPARPLEPTEMGNPAVVPLLGPAVLSMHQLHPLPQPDSEEGKKLGAGPYAPALWSTLDMWLRLAEEVEFGSSPAEAGKAKKLGDVLGGAGVGACRAQVEWLRGVLPSPSNDGGKGLVEAAGGVESSEGRAWALLSRRVFSHNDLLGANILVVQGGEEAKEGTKEGGLEGGPVRRVQLIDFEYGWFSLLGFDLANHFCEYAGFDFAACVDRDYPAGGRKLPTVRSYCEAVRSAAAGEAPSDLVKELAPLLPRGEADYAALCAALDRFALASNAFWGLWAVLQARHSPIDFDFAQYAVDRWLGFQKHKEAFCGGGAEGGGAAAGGGGEGGDES